MEQHQICDILVQILYISKLNKKENEKNAGNQAETVSSMGTESLELKEMGALPCDM